ncbi:hypothetical protein PFISCL1PPCAC_8550, partial [Pristionchus fissidentatus]
LNWKGHQLCSEAFSRIYKISVKQIKILTKEVTSGVVRSFHGNTGSMKNVTKTTADEGTLMNWYRVNGQDHP